MGIMVGGGGRCEYISALSGSNLMASSSILVRGKNQGHTSRGFESQDCIVKV